MSKIWNFENVDLFHILCPHKYKEYSEGHSIRQYNKEEYIYFEEDQANKVFLIQSGKVKIGYFTENGEEVLKTILTKGELFGEKAILGLEKQNDFAQSMTEDTQICVVSKSNLFEMMQDDSRIGFKINKFVGLRMKKIERRLELLLFKDTKTRLIEFLEDLKKEFGVKNEQGQEVLSHPYTQKEMAKLIGTSRPTLNSIFNELKQDNLIDFKRNKIFFLQTLPNVS